MVNDNYWDHKHAYKKLQDRRTVSFKVGDLDGKGLSVWDQMLDWLKHTDIPGYAKDLDLAVLSSRCGARLILFMLLLLLLLLVWSRLCKCTSHAPVFHITCASHSFFNSFLNSALQAGACSILS
jgi:hypothetical protein